MVRRNEIREGEASVTLPEQTDAALFFVGRIHTPWTDRMTCPRQGRLDGPTCRLEIFEPWVAAIDGILEYERLEVLYWLHESRRDIVRQSPRSDGIARGAFSLRTPVRPNPIGTHIVKLVAVEGSNVLVRGLDCLDGTPLLDLKPDRALFTPLAPRQPGDDQVDDRD
ncbi:MAG: tRNA (N6-threonylcarbamoyladenosine(37)-N6)-methyltransferase TrmO [Hyphomicrobiaceae bacterium]